MAMRLVEAVSRDALRPSSRPPFHVMRTVPATRVQVRARDQRLRRVAETEDEAIS